MVIRPLSLTAFFIVVLAGSFALPEPAEARGSSRRRNYADEMRHDQLEDERREDRSREDREYQAE
ncbi:MAG: hypothetical protein O7G30_15470 [Proteobacteria bacterium]|nr:hypothetical protein [Pseudomonadota bacterium]